jgi:hypothetical protein
MTKRCWLIVLKIGTKRMTPTLSLCPSNPVFQMSSLIQVYKSKLALKITDCCIRVRGWASICIHTNYGRPVWLATELVYDSLRGAPNLPPGRQPTSHLHVVQCHRYTVEPHFPVLATRACPCYFSEENPAMDIGQEIFLREQEPNNMYRFPAMYTLNPEPQQLQY